MSTQLPFLKKLMLVEDEPDIRFVICQVLEKLGGFEVFPCSSGAEALETINTFDPQLVLLDVMMPDMDGPATLKALRKLPRLQALPIVFITAKTQLDEVEKLKKMGAQAVIKKPFDPKKLSEQLRSIWQEATQARAS